MSAAAPDFWIVRNGRTFDIRSRRGLEMEGIETEGSAQDHLAEMQQDAADADALLAAQIEADAYETALDEIRDLVNAQGGTAVPGDHAAAGQRRAVFAALAAIDGLGMGACDQVAA